MPYGNPGFDWMCKEGYKIDNKASCLIKLGASGTIGWSYCIRCNKIADWFVLSAWDNRDNLYPLHVWAFHKNDMVKGRKFCSLSSFSITNAPKYLNNLKNWEITDRLDKLKELCNKK